MIRAKDVSESVLLEEKNSEIAKYKRDIINKCRICKGSGIIELSLTHWDRCDCYKKFLVYYGLCRGGVPDNMIGEIMRGEVFPRKCIIYPDKKESNVRKIYRQYVRKLARASREGIGLFIFGANGCGKTTMALHILNQAVKKNYYVYYLTLSKFLDIVIRGYKDDNAYNKMEEIAGVDFLVIDEFGKEPTQSRHSFDKIENLLRERFAEGLPTIILTNLSTKGMKDIYGESIISIITKNMLMIKVIDDVDFRQSTRISISDKLGV